jgi:predicted enzyme related to lactoylglutathione lyase
MGKRESYAPGTFSWVDLGTTDAASAKAFYTGLLGWETEDADAGNGLVYTICRVGGDAVCGLFERAAEAPSSGGAPGWTSYVTVPDADETAARAIGLGGEATDAFDVLDAGRMSMLQDPHGAALAVWQPGNRIGAERVNDVGCLCMNELVTSDLDAARGFYENLFGWTTEPVDTGPGGPPTVFAYNRGTLNASLTAVTDGEAAHWRPYFTVDSTAAASVLVRDLGGSVVLEPESIPDGSIAIATDPQGGLFGLFEGEVDP